MLGYPGSPHPLPPSTAPVRGAIPPPPPGLQQNWACTPPPSLHSNLFPPHLVRGHGGRCNGHAHTHTRSNGTSSSGGNEGGPMADML